jgi:hypothetical protein
MFEDLKARWRSIWRRVREAFGQAFEEIFLERCLGDIPRRVRGFREC